MPCPDLLWVRGGFPRSFLAAGETASFDWREGFVRTFLERDIPQLGINVPAETLRRFWTMIAHDHSQIWNAAEFARSLGASEGTARRQRSMYAIVACCTRCWAFRHATTYSGTRSRGPPGKASPWSRSWPNSAAGTPTSGPPTAEQSWI